MQDPADHKAAFADAQLRAQRLLAEVVGRLESGMSERDVRDLALEQGEAQGVVAWFRPPVVRIGAPPAVQWSDRPRAGVHLEPGAVIELELAPATQAAFGDAGLSLAFGVEPGSADEPGIVRESRELCRAVCGFASRWKCVGELFVFAEAWATNHRARLGGSHSVGFSALSPAQAWGGQWPRGAWAASLLRRNQVQYFNPRRMHGIYALRPRLVRDGQGAAFAELVYVTPEDKEILGRASLEQVGTPLVQAV